MNLPNILRAATVALAIGGTAVTAMPAQAQSIDLDFRFGGPGFSFNLGNGVRRGFCMSPREVRRDLRRDGYRDIEFRDRRGRIFHLIAELGRRDFRIAYDSCRGRIIDRDRIRR